MRNLPNRKTKIIIDACIFMLGIDDDNPCDIRKRKEIFLESCMDYFDDVYMHKVVYNEIRKDIDSKEYIDDLIKKGQITIVGDPQFDPVYSSYLEKLSEFDLLKTNNLRKNQGEIHSIAFAIANNINYFSTNDRAARTACEEIDICSTLSVIGLEDLLVIAEKTIPIDKIFETRKARKAIYKKHCRRQNFPRTFFDYVAEFA